MDLDAIQNALQQNNINGWLFYDFKNRDPIAQRILNLDPKKHTTRRWLYFIPASGDPQKILHKIEPLQLDHLPGQDNIYLSWKELNQTLKKILQGYDTIAMQYSPENAIPYISIVDAGTIDIIRNLGHNVISSADLVGQFESRLSATDMESHKKAGGIIQKIKNDAFAQVCRKINANDNPTEIEIQDYIKTQMQQNNMIWDGDPIVAINEHAANPHFEVTQKNTFTMQKGDLLLLDIWAKISAPPGIYYDITWMGFIDKSVPEKYENLFQIIRQARDQALMFIKDKMSKNEPVYGWQVDDVCRQSISKAGYGEYFSHRTGHNIGEQVHGNGVNIDNLETKDERQILPGTCFSLEPGLYIPEQNVGFRTEIDVFIDDNKTVHVFGDIQQRIIPILTL